MNLETFNVKDFPVCNLFNDNNVQVLKEKDWPVQQTSYAWRCTQKYDQLE